MFQRFLPKIITQKLSNKEKEDTIKVSNVISAIVVFESDNRAVISYSEAHIKSLQKILADPDGEEFLSNLLQDQSLIPLLKSDLNKHAISKKILDITTIGSTTLLAALVVYTAQTFGQQELESLYKLLSGMGVSFLGAVGSMVADSKLIQITGENIRSLVNYNDVQRPRLESKEDEFGSS